MVESAVAQEAKVTAPFSKELEESSGREALMLAVEYPPGGSDSIHRNNERNQEMNNLQPGDQIDIVFADAPGQPIRATVNRFLSDQQEGLSPEAEDYVFCWMEITPEHRGTLAQTQTIALGADWKCYMDGREVEIRKCLERAS